MKKNRRCNFNNKKEGEYTENNYLDEISFENNGSVINDNEYEVDSDNDKDKEKETSS